MSESENFLTRWSRRKRVTEEPDQPAPNRPTQSPDAAPTTASPDGETGSLAAPTPALKTSAPPKPAFDLASLPSLESIGAQTDIRAFMQAGVPSALRLAALRRVWSADPAISNFKGLAENDWDFTDPNAMTGFGNLDPGTDVKKMLAQMFDAPREAEPATGLPQPAEELAPSVLEPEIADQPPIKIAANDGMVHREENIAVQDSESKIDSEAGGQPDDAQIKRHGGALPK
jgi:Protein of unknown function (DUF3306)